MQKLEEYGIDELVNRLHNLNKAESAEPKTTWTTDPNATLGQIP